jgi:hypothetical protein
MLEIVDGKQACEEITIQVQGTNLDTEDIHPQAVEQEGNKLTVELRFKLPSYLYEKGDVSPVLLDLELAWMTMKEFSVHDVMIKRVAGNRKQFLAEDGIYVLQVMFDRSNLSDIRELEDNLTNALSRIQAIIISRHGERVNWVNR